MRSIQVSAREYKSFAESAVGKRNIKTYFVPFYERVLCETLASEGNAIEDVQAQLLLLDGIRATLSTPGCVKA